MSATPDTRSPTTVADAWSLWLAYRTLGTRPLRASTLADYESIYRAHLGPALCSTPLADLDGLTIARFVIAKTAAGVGAKRLSNVLVPLRACLRWHHRMGALPVDPSPWFDASAPPAQERRILTIPEIERLLAALPTEHRPFVAFSAYVGTRAGEQRALTWADIDLDRRTARIDKTLFRDRPQRSTKSGHDRTVPLPPHIATMLAEWLDVCPPSVRDLVFPARSGRPLDLDTFRARVFKPAVARAGLPDDLRIHDLRHTAASLLLQSGATVRDVMEICGWRQLSTAQRYLHPTATLSEAAERVSAARNAALAPRPPPSQAPQANPRYPS
jgi:integrase